MGRARQGLYHHQSERRQTGVAGPRGRHRLGEEPERHLAVHGPEGGGDRRRAAEDEHGEDTEERPEGVGEEGEEGLMLSKEKSVGRDPCGGCERADRV